MARGQLRIVDPDEESEAPAEQYAQALAAIGLQAEEGLGAVEDVFELWPDNVKTFHFWRLVQTQWHSDMGRRTGLNYPGIKVCMQMRGIPKKEQDVLFQQLQVMEAAALNEWDSQT